MLVILKYLKNQIIITTTNSKDIWKSPRGKIPKKVVIFGLLAILGGLNMTETV